MTPGITPPLASIITPVTAPVVLLWPAARLGISARTKIKRPHKRRAIEASDRGSAYQLIRRGPPRFDELGQPGVRVLPQIQKSPIFLLGAGFVAGLIEQAGDFKHISRLERRHPLLLRPVN